MVFVCGAVCWGFGGGRAACLWCSRVVFLASPRVLRLRGRPGSDDYVFVDFTFCCFIPNVALAASDGS